MWSIEFMRSPWIAGAMAWASCVVCPFAESREASPDAAALQAGTVDAFVVDSTGTRVPLKVTLAFQDMPSTSGIEIVARVTNSTSAPVEFDRCVLFERVALPPPMPNGREMRFLSFDATPMLAVGVMEREGWLAAARPDRSFPFLVAGLPLDAAAAKVTAPNVKIEGELHPKFRVEMTSEATFLGIEFAGTPQRLVPGASLTFPGIALSRGGENDDLAPRLDGCFRAMWSRAGYTPPTQLGLEELTPSAMPIAVQVDSIDLEFGGRFAMPRFGARGVPLDLLREFGDTSRPEMWMERTSEGGARVAIVLREALPKIVGLSARDLGLATDRDYIVRQGEREIGKFRSRFGLPLTPGVRHDLVVVPAAAATGSSGERVEYRWITPGSPEEVVQRSNEPPSDENDAFVRTRETLDQQGIVLVDLPGEGSIDALPRAIAEFLMPQFAVLRVDKRPKVPKGDSEKFTKQAANAEWAFGFPQSDPDAKSWLVCLEAGYLATPFQPRVIDGMPAARGFAVFTLPGVLVVTVGLSSEELDQVVRNLSDLKAMNDAIAKVIQATQAVRLSREPSGLVRAFQRYARWRSEDLVPGDPLVTQRWYSDASLGSARRLVSLPVVPGGPLVTEDVLEFVGPLMFALDLPSPFERPFLAVVRRMECDGELVFHFGGRPLTRIARTPRDRGRWVEELYLLKPEDFPGQVRVALAFEPSAGVGRIARATFFAPRKMNGLALSFVTPSAIAPGPASVSTGQRFDGSPLEFAGEGFENGFTLVAGATLQFSLPEKPRYRRLILKAAAPEGEPEQGGGWLIVKIDGEEQERFDLRPGRPEAVSIRIEKGSMKTVEFVVEARTSKFDRGTVLLLDPRVE